MFDTVSDMPPFRLYYWPNANFGDALSPLVVQYVSGRRVVHTGPKRAQMFAIGSLLQGVARHFVTRRPGVPPIFWGTGLLAPLHSLEFLENIDIRLMRGPIGASIANLAMRDFGDPGLLAPEVIGAPAGRKDRIVVVPHHSQMETPDIGKLKECDPKIRVVDPRQPPDIVCREIAGAAHVFASSLHGLIVADAYGVANTWMTPGALGRLKYFDYAASVGRALLYPVEIEDVALLASRVPTGELGYRDGIARSRASLLDSFPAELKMNEAEGETNEKSSETMQ